MKKLIIEILIIVGVSVLLALAFNTMRQKPVPYIYKEAKPIEISEAELFGDTNIEKKIDSLVVNPKDFQPSEKYSAKDFVAKPMDDTMEVVNSKISKITEEHKNEQGVKSVTYNQMLKILTSDEFVVIDARNAENFQKAHIGKAINIFPYDDESVYIPKILELPKDKKIVIYCDGGKCDSSHKLAEAIISFGYDKVYIYNGGWEEWSNKNGK